MKQWFPFTDYDFYAYITAGMLLIAACDLTFGGAVLFHRTDWTVVQITFWTAISYLVGQLIAGPSSALLEHTIARTLLHPPIAISLGLRTPRWREILIGGVFAKREYSPLPVHIRKRILTGAAENLGIPVDEINDPETVFSIAFGIARSSPDTLSRMDQFRNLYGFSRNISFVSMICFLLIAFRFNYLPSDLNKYFILFGSLVISIGMFGRFIKFYAAYSREMLGAYNSKLMAASKQEK